MNYIGISISAAYRYKRLKMLGRPYKELSYICTIRKIVIGSDPMFDNKTFTIRADIALHRLLKIVQSELLSIDMKGLTEIVLVMYE